MLRSDAIIWDFNGTILDDADLAASAIGEILARRGLPRISTETHRNSFGFPIAEYYRKLGLDLEKEGLSDISDEFHEVYLRGVEQCSLNEGIQQALECLREMGVRQFVLSAAEQEMVEAWVISAGVQGFFEAVYGLSDRLAVTKVDRGKELVDTFGLSGGRTLLIGDTDHDAEVAEDIGCDVILVPAGHQTRSRLQRVDCKFLDAFVDFFQLVREWDKGKEEAGTSGG